MVRRMLILVTTAAGLAAVLALAGLPVRGMHHAPWYSWLTAFLLAIGLYCSTYTIDLQDLRRDLRLVISAVTIGVLAKALLIGACLVAVFDDPFYWIIGLAVAQIDPISVAALESSSRMSQRAKNILKAWSSLDDPVTTILTLYAPLLVYWLTQNNEVPELVILSGGLPEYALNIAHSLAFTCVMYSLWRLSETAGWQWIRYPALVALFVGVVLLAGSYWFWMLGVAIAGLAVRPPLGTIIDHAPKFAFFVSSWLLFSLMYQGVDLGPGILLGVAAFGSQVVVGLWLTRKLAREDRWRLALAQQNGITAVILALVLETIHPGTVAVIAPAIFVVAVLYVTTNKLANRWL